MNLEGIQLVIMPERPVIRNDERTEFDVVVEVRCTKVAEPALSEKALNLCLVIDRSGSMAGTKLETAKRSCVDIFKRLGEKDLFTVVLFDDKAEVIVNPQIPKAEIATRIEQITAGGNTNLSLGWYLGLLELQTHATQNHNNRLFLLSDGQANAGETKRATLSKEAFQARERGITTSTIGIGEDFQEDLLEAIATESGGRFWYIQESKIEDIIAHEFKGSLSVFLDRPRMELVLPDGVAVSKELNTLTKVSGKYRVRPLKGLDTFNFAVRLEATPDRIGAKDFTLTAVLYDADKRLLETNEKIRLSSREESVVSASNPLVRSVVQQYEVTATKEEMMAKMSEGDFDVFKKMLVAEVDGMRVVQDALEEERKNELVLEQNERVLMELKNVGMALAMKDASLGIVEMLEEFVGTPEVTSFLQRVRKALMFESHREAQRHYGVEEFDEDAYNSLLEGAIDLTEILIQRYPQKADKIVEHRNKLERLARHQ